MFWLAVLVLAVIGFNAPRKWLARGLRGATESTLKFCMFLGAASLILFGLIAIAPGLDFFIALLPAGALWLGMFAVFELGRRRTTETDTTLEPEPHEQPGVRSAQPHAGLSTTQSAFEQDPWAVLARRQQAEQRALASKNPRAQSAPPAPPATVWPLANLLAKPNGKAKPEREDAGMVVFLPEELPAAPAAAAVAETPPPAPAPDEAAAKSALLNVLNVHVAAPDTPKPNAAAQASAATPAKPADTADQDAAPSVAATAEHTEEHLAQAPTPSSAYASTAPAKSEVAPRLKPAAPTPPSAAGKYKYEPKLVKSLFGKEPAK